ncbi:antibiotic biosynthesis monooxygenase [Methylobacterium sp. GC_Met_2]|uniref:putative quinol monooxygenase n=1 Tax=Methylobacterium sp. GC_Met_2 TaxID=2937376 RepID=UPI00226B6063|nr:antibiotic biosynthesis monooxygenase [Methylobacterium sp. GC_Met_2]
MDKRAVWSTFRAKPGREDEVEAFLEACAAGIAGERGTTTFFALRLVDGRYATFADDAAFQAHLTGPTALTVMDRAHDLFADGVDIVQAQVLAAKEPER